MLLILITALALNISSHFNLLKNMSPVSAAAHKKCLNIIPKVSKNYASLTSLVCGEKITDAELRGNLIKTSIIHIFIVSGSHLIFIDSFFEFFCFPFFVRFIFLSIYSMATGLEPPTVRALIGIIIKKIIRDKSWGYPSDLLTLLTGLCTLNFFSSWWQSISFLMSWCASLALSAPSLLRIKTPLLRVFCSQCSVFIIMLFPLFSFGSLHPLSILYNLFLGNIVAFVLLPLSFLALLNSNLTLLFDNFMELFNSAVAHFSEPILIESHTPLPIGYLWVWLFSWHLLFHFSRIYLFKGMSQ